MGLKQPFQRLVGRLHQPQKQMLYGDVVVLHVRGLLFRGYQGFVQLGGDIHFVRLPACARYPRDLLQRLLQGRNYPFVPPHAPQQLHEQRILLLQ